MTIKSNITTVLTSLSVVFVLLTTGCSNNEVEDSVSAVKSEISINFSPKEQDYLKHNNHVTACIDPNWMPFESFKDTNHIGLTADYFKLFEKKANIKLDVIKTETWSESIEAAKKRKCDIMSLVMETEDRKKYLRFTTPYFTTPLVIATKPDVEYMSGINSLSDKVIGIPKGYAFNEILRKKFPDFTIVDVENTRDGLQKVNSSKIYAYIGTLATVGYLFQTEFTGELKIAGKLDETWSLGLGIRNDDSTLFSILQKVVNSVNEVEKQNILNNWIAINYEEGIDYSLVWKVVFFALLIIAASIYWNRRLSNLNKELEQAKQKAEEATLTKSEFLANMSHEIRTPLNGIIGFVDILYRDEIDSKKQEKLKIVKESGNSLLNIINDILDFSKIESGKLLIEKMPLNISEVFNHVIELFFAKAKEKNITIKFSLDEKIPKYTLGDSTRLKQVFSNLLSNAIKFADTNSVIITKINYLEDTNELYCEVIDKGIGIAPEKIQSIFNPFEQEDSSTTRKYGGTGLGLSITKILIELMGGRIGVRSEVGRGSEFYFSVPLFEVNEDIEIDEVVVNTKPLSGTILIAEDNKTNQMLLSILLDELKLEYFIANDGLEAVEALKNDNYVLILMDENMPNMNGTEATKVIRALDGKKDIPIIAVTANALKGDKEKFIESGMNDYISKPIDANKLKNILQKYLS